MHIFEIEPLISLGFWRFIFGENEYFNRLLKTGSATLSPARIQQIQAHVPGGNNVPVLLVRP
jgi:hypothetical protein